MSGPTCSVELAHVYRQELEQEGFGEWAARAERDMAAIPCGEDYGPTLVFVDDYPDAYEPHEKERIAWRLNQYAANVGITLDVVAYESACADAAEVLGEHLPHSEWWLTRNGNTHRTAVLIREQAGYWTCPALTAVWTLARLGVEPYTALVLNKARRFTDKFVADNVMTVLPVQYIGNEAAVVDMLRQLRKPRIPLSRVRYVFT